MTWRGGADTENRAPGLFRDQVPDSTPDTTALLRELIAHNYLEIGRADGKAAVLLATGGSFLSPAPGSKARRRSLDAVSVVVRRARRRRSRRGTSSGPHPAPGFRSASGHTGIHVFRGCGAGSKQVPPVHGSGRQRQSPGNQAVAGTPRRQPDRAHQESLRELGCPPSSPRPPHDTRGAGTRQLIKVSRQGLPGLLGVSRNRHASVFSSRANASGGRGSGSRLGITISPGAGSCSYGPVRQYERLSPGRICPVGLIFMPARPPAACLGMPSSSPIGVLGQNFHRPRRGSPSLARHCGPT